MKNLKELLQAIESASSFEEIKQIKIDFGYADILKQVGNITEVTRKKIKIKQAKDRRENEIKDRKVLLKKHIGEMIHYIGRPYKKLYKNRPCKLIKVNKTKCLVEFSGKDGSWNIPLRELHPHKTNAGYMVFTKNGFNLE